MKTCVALRVPCYSYLQSTPSAAKAPVAARFGLETAGSYIGRPQCQNYEKVKMDKMDKKWTKMDKNWTKMGKKAEQIFPKQC